VNITVTENPDRTIITLAGDDNAPGNIDQLREVLERAIGRGLEVVLAIRELFYLGSEGVGVIAAAHKASKEKGLKLIIRQPSPQVARVFMVTRLDTFLSIERDEPGS
jgi:anti-anti-sigma factor